MTLDEQRITALKAFDNAAKQVIQDWQDLGHVTPESIKALQIARSKNPD